MKVFGNFSSMNAYMFRTSVIIFLTLTFKCVFNNLTSVVRPNSVLELLPSRQLFSIGTILTYRKFTRVTITTLSRRDTVWNASFDGVIGVSCQKIRLSALPRETCDATDEVFVRYIIFSIMTHNRSYD